MTVYSQRRDAREERVQALIEVCQGPFGVRWGRGWRYGFLRRGIGMFHARGWFPWRGREGYLFLSIANLRGIRRRKSGCQLPRSDEGGGEVTQLVKIETMHTEK